MSKYSLEGSVVNTQNAKRIWEEKTWWNGSNHCSVNTGDQFLHQTLYESRRGRYYLEHTSQWQGSRPRAEWVSPEAAARWLILNDHELPTELERHREEIEESDGRHRNPENAIGIDDR